MEKGSGINIDVVKSNNRALIMREIQMSPCSRADLSRKSGLTRASLTNIVSELLAEGMVLETGTKVRTRGRPSEQLEVNRDYGVATGICLKRDVGYFGIVNFKGEVLKEQILPIRGMEWTRASILDALTDQIRKMNAEFGAFRKLGVGVATPGPLSAEEGVIYNPIDFADGALRDVPLVSLLQERLNCPVYLQNDVVANAMAEAHYGVKDTLGDFIELNADAGIGAALVRGGRVSPGMEGIGHISIDYRGEPCVCGNRGCVELYASINRIEKEAAARDPGYGRWQDIVDRAIDGDSFAADIVRQEASYLATAITTAANLSPFETVVLAGYLAYRGEKIAGEIEKTVNGQIFNHEHKQIRVLPTALQKHVNVLSGAELVFSRYIDHTMWESERKTE